MSIVVIVLVVIGIVGAEACPSITSRAEWGARQAVNSRRLTKDPPPYVIVHHSDTPSCLTKSACNVRVKNIQEYHMNHNGWKDIGYNFLIGGEGTIYEGRGWSMLGAHAKNFNSRSIGISLIGTLQDTNPTDAQLTALNQLISCGVSKGKIDSNYRLIGHRQAGQTTCPGDKMFGILKSMPNFYLNPR